MMRRLGPALALGALLATPAMASLAPADRGMSAYVEARLAQASLDYGLAAQRYAEALKLTPDPIAERRAFDVAMITGDRKAVQQLGQRIRLAERSPEETAAADSIVALTRVAMAADARDWDRYDAACAEFSAPGRGGESGRLLANLMAAWGRAARGDIDGALALLDSAPDSGLGQSYIAEHRAHILSFAGRWKEAAAAYGALIADGGGNVSRLRLGAASTLLQAAPDDAATREEVILLLAGGLAEDPQLAAARAKMIARPRLGGRQLGYLIDSPAQGLALVFVRLAADLARGQAFGPAISFARLATFADPRLPDGWLVTADLLSLSERYDLALTALDRVPARDGWGELADARRAATLVAAGRNAQARHLLRARTSRAGARVSDWSRLADLERREENYPAAVAAYDSALELVPDDDRAQRAQLLFLRGSAQERDGDWHQAAQDLRAAVALQGENPIYLNYLGYSMLEHGGDLQEARGLIARAYAAAPESGAITDSMGWAEHLLGDQSEAVRLLTEAQSAEPADPTVADHLGDALWTVGRRIEARYAWRAAAALSPEPRLADALQRKLDFGLAPLRPQ